VRPDDKRWAIGITVGIAAFFALVIMAGRVYLTDVDRAFTISDASETIEARLAIWLLRNDSKNIPIQVNPPVEGTLEFGGRKVYIQKEYMAANSQATLQMRSARRILVDSDSPPTSAQLEVEVLHFKAPTHRAVIVVEPDPNMTRSTELYLDEIDPTRVRYETIDLNPRWTKELFGHRYSAKLREKFFTFSGQDDLWRVDAYDSISHTTESFDAMALFKVRTKLTLAWDDGTRASTDWMETQFFAVDLV